MEGLCQEFHVVGILQDKAVGRRQVPTAMSSSTPSYRAAAVVFRREAGYVFLIIQDACFKENSWQEMRNEPPSGTG